MKSKDWRTTRRLRKMEPADLSLGVFDSYTEIGRGLVAKSMLEAAGFHPSFENFYYASILPPEMLALGGLKLKLPFAEMNDARAYMYAASVDAPLEHDPLPERKFGRWMAPSSYLFLYAFAFFPLPVLFLPIRWILTLLLLFNLYTRAYAPDYQHIGLVYTIAILILVALLLHAKHIALPRIMKGHENVD